MKPLPAGKKSSQANPAQTQKREAQNSHLALFWASPYLAASYSTVRLSGGFLAVHHAKQAVDHLILSCGGLEVHGIP